jgi:hypothetical protein
MKNACPSSLKLALSLVEGELAQEDRAGIQAHAASCGRCRGRLAELEREREMLYAQKPTLELDAHVTARPGRLVWWPALAGAVAVLLLLFGLWLSPGGDTPNGVQFKGEAPSLALRVEHEGRVFHGSSHMHLQPGDRIRFAYSVDADAFLYIFNVDKHGRITDYYPARDGESLAIRAGTEIFLPGSIRLDDYLGTERIFALFTRVPVRRESIAAAVRQAMERMERIEDIQALPIKGVQETILIEKVSGNEQ